MITYLIVAAFLVLLAGGGFAAFESRQVSNVGEGLWWALSLVAGGGFVAEVPESVTGRLLASVLMIARFGLMALVTAAVASLFVREEQEPEDQAEEAFEARALVLLTELASRIEALESTLAPTAPSAEHRDPGSPAGS
ncbi:hypothetical protein NPS01_39980 [Nocardioides psychrotolerans]|uniref:Potassium channel domain-containing protein n=1 Tax=Nocardioides psychrotolerans TaxID=1005945 RepID=A0A1I3R6J6_9ACTN|nr:ion channel [Nocardioides psychrotolerans]GEP40335.1 hypothetical protein NPS01_39980 [Nocardioides psychrotolerans]SFJ42223.1 hypothetical protein SAMN05216561_13011 [Nocardioides psychrotolerans]